MTPTYTRDPRRHDDGTHCSGPALTAAQLPTLWTCPSCATSYYGEHRTLPYTHHGRIIPTTVVVWHRTDGGPPDRIPTPAPQQGSTA